MDGRGPSRSDEPEAKRQAVNSGRRNFLIGGVAIGVPVVMTLASRSAFAGQCSISGTLSGNLSQPHTHCQGCDAHTWACNPSSWPSGYTPGQPNPVTCFGQGTPSDYSFCNNDQLGELRRPPFNWNSTQVNYYKQTACAAVLYNYAVWNRSPMVCGSYPSGGNPPLTLMQALWSGNTTESTYAACILNAANWGTSFGYTVSQMQELIASRDGDPTFVPQLQLLFNRA